MWEKSMAMAESLLLVAAVGAVAAAVLRAWERARPSQPVLLELEMDDVQLDPYQLSLLTVGPERMPRN